MSMCLVFLRCKDVTDLIEIPNGYGLYPRFSRFDSFYRHI